MNKEFQKPLNAPVISLDNCEQCGIKIPAYMGGICNDCHRAKMEAVNALNRCAYPKCNKIIKEGKYCKNWGKCEGNHSLQMIRERKAKREAEKQKITLSLF